MKALTVIPGRPNSASLCDMPEAPLTDGEILCEMLAIGICGTDVEINQGKYGTAPEGSPFLVLGHESLGRVLSAPSGSAFAAGDLIVGFVRRPDPLPCLNCAMGEWDMCRNGLYSERGIKGLHGYASERYRLEEKYSIRLSQSLQSVGVLIEPASIVAKAWEQILRIAARGTVPPRRALVTGAGPVGLLAALLGIQHGLDVHVYDLAKEGPKPDLVRALGATYHSELTDLLMDSMDFDVTLECTGSAELIIRLFKHIQSDGILCLAGVSSGGRMFPTDVGALNLKIVLQNEVIFGSVNANRRHYEAASMALMTADRSWLEKLITRRIPFSQWQKAFQKEKTDIKVILTGESPHA